MKVYVYVIDLGRGRRYVGQTVAPWRRFPEHCSTHWKAVQFLRGHRALTFEIVATCESVFEARNVEWRTARLLVGQGLEVVNEPLTGFEASRVHAWKNR